MIGLYNRLAATLTTKSRPMARPQEHGRAAIAADQLRLSGGASQPVGTDNQAPAAVAPDQVAVPVVNQAPAPVAPLEPTPVVVPAPVEGVAPSLDDENAPFQILPAPADAPVPAPVDAAPAPVDASP